MSHRTFASVVPALLLPFIALHASAAGATPSDAAAAPATAAPDADKDEPDAPAAVPAAPVKVAKAVPEAATTGPAPIAEPSPSATRMECKHALISSDGWRIGACGYVALNAMHDSTQALGAGLNNAIIARPGTYAGDHDQMQFTAKDSRINIEGSAPTMNGIDTSGLIQMDFTGVMPSDVTENDSYIFGTPRLRLAVIKVKSPVVDLLFGQYHDLFAWGGSGFFPATLGFLGVPGEVYHRQPQARVSKTFHSDVADFEIAVAAVRPVQKAAGIPDGEAGLRLAFNQWTGANTQGYGQPSIGPAAIGVSGIARRFRLADFQAVPGDSTNGYGWGFAANVIIPVIPRSTNEDRSNGLTLTGEFTTGSGIADLYTGLTGGLLFPTLPNDPGTTPAPLYTPNIDPGIVTYDGNGNLKTADWRAIVLGVQYYLPIARGRVWLSGIYSQTRSANIVKLTPIPDRGTVFFKSEYEDASLFAALTDALQLSASFQTVHQLFGDGAEARDNRIEFGAHFFF